MKYFTLLLSLSLACCFFSCLEEEDQTIIFDNDPGQVIDRPGDGSIVPRERVDASEVAGLQFSMAEINLEGPSGLRTTFSMSSCYLSVFEAECAGGNQCLSRLDEDVSSFTFNNTYRADPDNDNFNTLSFNDNGVPGAVVGSFGEFLKTEVYPLVGGDYDFKVYRQENKVILECSDCPMARGNQEYDFRRITLTVR